jgi:hypothetical protein
MPALKEAAAANRWSRSLAIGARGVSLVIAEMYEHQIVPCVPLLDIGYDLIAAHNNVLNRVQVKSTAVKTETTNGLCSFSVRRHKSCRFRRQKPGKTSQYSENEIDVFIFVHTELRQFFIVPGAEILYCRHKISFLPDSVWRDAWHILKA